MGVVVEFGSNGLREDGGTVREIGKGKRVRTEKMVMWERGEGEMHTRNIAPIWFQLPEGLQQCSQYVWMGSQADPNC